MKKEFIYQKEILKKIAALFLSLIITGLLPTYTNIFVFTNAVTINSSNIEFEEFIKGNWTHPLPEGTYYPVIAGTGRAFGELRDGGKRLHAGIDFVCNNGTPVYAMTSGTVSGIINNFYGDSSSLSVHNVDGSTLHYCEIRPIVTYGKYVEKGEVLGYVMTPSGKSTQMLHLELFRGTAEGRLCQAGSVYDYVNYSGITYNRRRDLLDPTFLQNLPFINNTTLPENSSIYGDNISMPNDIHIQGNSQPIYGIVNSTNPISKITGGVLDLNWNGILGAYVDYAPSTTIYKYDLSAFNNKIIFGNLPEGTYNYAWWVHDSSGNYELVAHKQFTVTKTLQSRIWGDGISFPNDMHILGDNQPIYGAVNSTKPITKITGGVLDLNWNGISGAYVDYAPSTTIYKYDLAAFDNKIIFGNLPEGTYNYAWWCHDSSGNYELVAHKQFKVVTKQVVLIPTYAKLKIDKESYNTEENVVFSFDSDYASSYYLKICNINGDFYEKNLTENTHAVKLPIGSYSAYLSAVNISGSVDSEWISFEVYNKKLTGDINGDELVDNLDLVYLCQHLIKDKLIDSQFTENADINKNGIIDIADLAVLKQYIMGDKITLN